eukprot:gb/GFBE01009731.1/.p1 GENE.gb/GFBE01009731.1/~~gb/GFBE01009731.1/.p1  ORF type:complete len:412 (+),score=46.58 gb/GFBE01009731.1/:1-1236(+)
MDGGLWRVALLFTQATCRQPSVRKEPPWQVVIDASATAMFLEQEAANETTQFFEFVGCASLTTGWTRMRDKHLTEGGIEECLMECRTGGYKYGGLECPTPYSTVRCLCSNQAAFTAHSDPSGTCGEPVSQCSGQSRVGPYSTGGWGERSVYLLDERGLGQLKNAPADNPEDSSTPVCTLSCEQCRFNWYRDNFNKGRPTAEYGKHCECCGGTQIDQQTCKDVCTKEVYCPSRAAHASHRDRKLCEDGSFFATCGREHGKVIQCPKDAPYMCADRECAGEHCCMQTAQLCKKHGGLRTCPAPSRCRVAEEHLYMWDGVNDLLYGTFQTDSHVLCKSMCEYEPTCLAWTWVQFSQRETGNPMIHEGVCKRWKHAPSEQRVLNKSDPKWKEGTWFGGYCRGPGQAWAQVQYHTN